MSSATHRQLHSSHTYCRWCYHTIRHLGIHCNSRTHRDTHLHYCNMLRIVRSVILPLQGHSPSRKSKCRTIPYHNRRNDRRRRRITDTYRHRRYMHRTKHSVPRLPLNTPHVLHMFRTNPSDLRYPRSKGSGDPKSNLCRYLYYNDHRIRKCNLRSKDYRNIHNKFLLLRLRRQTAARLQLAKQL